MVLESLETVDPLVLLTRRMGSAMPTSPIKWEPKWGAIPATWPSVAL